MVFVRRAHKALVVRLVLAALTLLALSPATLAAITCSAGSCGKTCGMHKAAPSPDASATHDCCAGKAAAGPAPEKPGKDGCKCEFKASPDVAPALQALIKGISPLPTAAIAPVAIEVPQPPPSPRGAAAIFHSDSSPPNVFHHPDLGRAPPSA